MNPAKDPLLPYVRGSVPAPRPSEGEETPPVRCVFPTGFGPCVLEAGHDGMHNGVWDHRGSTRDAPTFDDIRKAQEHWEPASVTAVARRLEQEAKGNIEPDRIAELIRTSPVAAAIYNIMRHEHERQSPSVPTATQEQRDAGVAEATYWRDKAKHMAALMAMAGATLCEPVSTANIRDAKKSCDLGVHVMREIIDDEKRVSSSEEAANSDTDRLDEAEIRRLRAGDRA